VWSSEQKSQVWFAVVGRLVTWPLKADACECGVALVRGKRPATKSGGDDMEKVKDLVCDMWVDPESAAATSEHKGKTYYFCARGCKVAFDKDPEKYIQAEQEK
jgi:Cu+-exporting ATPase